MAVSNRVPVTPLENKKCINKHADHLDSYVDDHVDECTALLNKLFRQQRENASLHATINTLSQPTFVVNQSMQLCYSNTAAESLMADNHYFSIQQDTLLFHDKQQQQQCLDKLHASIQGSTRFNSTLFIAANSASENGPVSITLSPIFSRDNSQQKHVLLQVFDLGQQPLPSAESIQALFGLSKKEGLLCEYLLKGLTLKEIAEKRYVSINTVREQMRNIFNKTGYHRQAQLIAAILRLLPA